MMCLLAVHMEVWQWNVSSNAPSDLTLCEAAMQAVLALARTGGSDVSCAEQCWGLGARLAAALTLLCIAGPFTCTLMLQ